MLADVGPSMRRMEAAATAGMEVQHRREQQRRSEENWRLEERAMRENRKEVARGKWGARGKQRWLWEWNPNADA